MDSALSVKAREKTLPKEIILKFLEKYNLLDSNNVLIVAFSGGADSLCLLDVVYKLSGIYNFRVIAAHLNHNWRGIESKIEQEKAQKYCVQRNIEFYTETLPENRPHTELEARKQRYIFFNKAAEIFKAGGILTGHTLMDQVETIFYRVIKGTGTLGLKGIPQIRHQESSCPIYRPMLNIKREQTVKYCEENNLIPSIDSSNFNEKYQRNKIRLNLIPELKTYNLNIENAILSLSQKSCEAEEIIEEYLINIKKEILKNNEIDTAKFFKLSIAVKKRFILDFLIKNKLDYSFEKIDEILNFIEENLNSKSGNTLSLTKNLWLFVSCRIIGLINSIKADMKQESVIVNIEGETCHPGLRKTLKILPWIESTHAKYEKIIFPPETANTAYIDLSNIKKPLYFRTRQPGDRIQPFGMKEKVKLKKYLINKAVPEFKRDMIPILATDSEVLWAVGTGISELLKVKDLPTHIVQVC